MCNQSIRIIAVILVSTSALLGIRPAFGQVEFTWQGDGGNNNWQNAQNWDQQPGNGDYPNATDHNVTLNNNADRFDVDLSGSTRTVGEFGMASFSDQQYIVFNGLLRLRDLDMSHGPDTGQIFDVGIEQYDAGTWDMNFARIVVNGQLSGSSNILLTGVTINVAAELNNANPYSGQITLEEKLRLGHSHALQNASVVMAANNKLDVNTNSIDATLGALSGTGNLNIGSTAMTVGGRNLTTTFSGNLIGTGSFDKIGNGAMTLSGAISGLSLLRNAGVGDLILTGGGSFQTVFAVDGDILVDGATLDLTNDTGNTLLVRNNAGVQIQGGATVQLTGASGTNRVVIVNDGSLTVTGSGTNLTAPRLDVGPSGSGIASANVLSQATVNVNELRIGDLGSDDGASGAFGIVSNAAVDANDVVFYRRSSLAAIGGPMTIDRLIEGDSAPSHTITISDTAASAALTIGVNGGDSAFDGLINEGPIAGSIRKEGAGTLELSGANTFSGGVIVNGGTLLANNTTGSATGTGGVIVGAGATLSGTGTAAGTTVVESGGTVAPGVTVGTLRVDDVTFESGSNFDVELVLSTETERLVVNQTATLGGTLKLTNLGAPPFPGVTYVILTANNLVGTFDEVISTDGVTWSVEYDAVTAEVRVVACADEDNDGVCDDDDICSGFDDNIDADSDGVPDGCDVCPGFDDTMDSDNDGVPNGCDACNGFDDNIDTDGDGVADGCDDCPADNPDDSDGDGVCDSTDACPGFDDNADADGDGAADGCDVCPADNPDDSDGDGVCDSADTCPGFDDNLDTDSDGVADGCDSCTGGDDNVDSDGDGVPDFCDSCPADNPNDSDGDGICDSNDVCPGGDDSVDGDGDGVADFCDSCPLDNPDDSDGDGVCDSNDACPGGDDNVDADTDGVPDGCDQCPDSPNVHNVSQGTFHATIAQAIAASMQGDVIELGACVFDERDLTLEGHNITIRGQGPAATIVDGQGIAKTIFRLQTGDVSTIENLTVQNGVGHLSVGGGAVLVIGAATTPTFRNVAFLNNSSGGNRFGAVSINGGSCLFERCAFRGNSTSDADGASTFAVGGEATATFIDCLFDGETGGAQMGEVAAVEDPAFGRFVNCTFANYDGDRFLYTAGFESSVEILNSVFDTSSTPAIAEFTAAATLLRCVYPGATGDNIDGTPTFVGAASGDYRLAPGSLGIDAADFDAYVAAGGGASDLNGDPRTYDDVGTVDTGIGALTYLDMGAFEYQGTSTCDDADNDGVCDIDDVCPDFDDLADADGDGIPDGCDVCPNRRIGDVSGDGVVAMDDIARFVVVMLEPDAATEDEICAVDTNLDGAGNGLDVQAFLGLILGG